MPGPALALSWEFSRESADWFSASWRWQSPPGSFQGLLSSLRTETHGSTGKSGATVQGKSLGCSQEWKLINTGWQSMFNKLLNFLILFLPLNKWEKLGRGSYTLGGFFQCWTSVTQKLDGSGCHREANLKNQENQTWLASWMVQCDVCHTPREVFLPPNWIIVWWSL